MASRPAPARVPCGYHPQASALAKCGACGVALCNECWRFRLDGGPACARCAYEAATRSRRRVSLGVAFVTLALGGEAWACVKYDLWTEFPGEVIVATLGALGIGGWLLASAWQTNPVTVERREPDDEPPPEPPPESTAHPYRARLRQVLMTAAPSVSGAVTALVVALSLAGSAVLVPFSLKLPYWVETRIVLGSWWVIMAATLVVMLYRGFRLRDDYVYFLPWDRPASPGQASTTGAAGTGGRGGLLDGCTSRHGCSNVDGCGDVEGCGAALVIGLALLGALGAAWVLVELAMPLLFLMIYGLLMRAIRRVARDQRGCRGDLGKSLLWGAWWATVYLLPMAAFTWLVHWARR